MNTHERRQELEKELIQLRATKAEIEGNAIEHRGGKLSDAQTAAVDSIDKHINFREIQLDRLAEQDEQIEREAPVAAVLDASAKKGTKMTNNNELRDRLLAGEAVELEVRDLTVGTATDGAELSLTRMGNRIIEQASEGVAVRQAGVPVLTFDHGADVAYPVQSSGTALSPVAEAGTIGESDPQFSTKTLSFQKFAKITEVSTELLQDSQFNLETFLTRDHARAIAATWQSETVTGTNVTDGIVANGTVGVTAAATSGVSADELLDLLASVDTTHADDLQIMMAPATWAAIRQLKDGQNNYLLGSLGNGAGNVLAGRPVYLNSQMDDVTSGASSIVAVAFDPQSYALAVGGGIRFEASRDACWENDVVSFRSVVRCEAAILDPAGIRTLQLAAS